MMKPRLFFLCFLFSIGLSAQDYTMAVKPDSSGQVYLQTDTYCGMSSLQWQVRDNLEADWQDMPGATATILPIPATEVDSAHYRCKFLFLPDTSAKYSYVFTLRMVDSIADVNIGEYVNRQFVYYNAGDTLLGTAFPGLRAPWGCLDVNAEATEELTGIGQGRLSTQILLDSCSDEYAAAYIVDKLDFNGHIDWYLPSEEELKKMVEMYQAIEYEPLPYTDEDGYNPFSQRFYWTANSRSEGNALWVFINSLNYQLNNYPKTFELGVIPSRDISSSVPVSPVAFVDIRFFQFQESPLVQVDSIDLVRSRVRYEGEVNPDEATFTLQDRGRQLWESLSTPSYFEWTDTSEAGIVLEFNDAGYHRVKVILEAEGCTSIPMFSPQFKKEVFQPLASNPFPEVYNGVADFVDVNQDGWLDAYFNGPDAHLYGTDTSALYLNIQADSFLWVLTPFEGLLGTESVWADFNKDGFIDLMLTGYESDSIPRIYQYQQQEDGSFESVPATIAPLSLGSLDGFDQDNDGNLDILITGLDAAGNAHSRLYTGNGDGSFELADIMLPAFFNSSAAIDDFNNDGFEDIALLGKVDSERQVMVFINRLHQFETLEMDFPGVDHGGIHWGYLDEDEKLDFIYTGLIADAVITTAGTPNGSPIQSHTIVAIQKDSIQFEAEEMMGVRHDSYSFSSIDLGDYDNDGDTDITAIGIPSAGWVITGIGGGGLGQIIYRSMGALIRMDHSGYTYSEINLPLVYTGNTFDPIITSGFESSTIGFGDFDNDHKLDILREGNASITGGGMALSSGVFANRSWLYRNGSLRENEPPTAPSNLQATVLCDSVFLSWDMGTDDHTLPVHLTYEVRIGTAPGASDIWTTLQDREIRTPYLPVRKLQPGTYYWSARSVDGALVKGDYAEEQSFTIIATPDTPLGTVCDDGLAYTEEDQIVAGCACEGTLVCNTLSSPANGEVDVPQNAVLSWEPIPGALGYWLNIGLSPGGSELLSGLDVGVANTYQPDDLPLGDTLFVTLTPYYEEGTATACPATQFVVSVCPPVSVEVSLDTILCAGESLLLNEVLYTTSGSFLDTIWTGDCPFAQEVNIAVQSEPVLFDSLLISMTTADTLLLSPNGAYATYLWQDGSTMETLPIYGADLAPGIYELSLTVEDEEGCVWTQNLQLLVEQAVGTRSPVEDATPAFFPNPTTGLLWVRLPDGIPEMELSIFSAQAQRLQESTVRHSEATLDLSGWPAGVYWVRWAHKTGHGVERIVVE